MALHSFSIWEIKTLDLDLDFDFDALDFFVLAILFSLYLSFFQSLYQSIPKGMDAYTIFFLLIIVGYLFLYVSGKYYLRDGFQPSESLERNICLQYCEAD